MAGMKAFRNGVRLPALLLALVLAGLCPAGAHPVDQYRMEIDLLPRRVEVLVVMPLPQAGQAPAVQGDALNANPGTPGFLKFHLAADGQPLEGREQPPHEKSDANAAWLECPTVYMLDSEPARLHLSLDPAETGSCVVLIHRPDGRTTTELLSSRQPVEIFLGNPPAAAEASGPVKAAAAPSPEGSGRLFLAYMKHGLWHILTGYDHMLFMAALALAAVSLWDLIKVVTAFTLAHTVTLTLAVLHLARLDARIVEPMIALSIVAVALQNIVSPAHSRGWMRLAVAFGFGLFHGLGFAGGLLEAMSGLSGLTVAAAITAFSLGVEAGHQVVVVPLYAGRSLIRRRAGERAERIERRIAVAGSALIAAAGTYYCVLALRG
jgi:hydrogenase/urease accessory protein HupE